MKYIELQYAFELEAANLDKPITEKISSEDILYWLNQAVYRFITTRYNGNNTNQTSFEQDEKRVRDLSKLLSVKFISSLSGELSDGYQTQNYVFPEDLMFLVDERVTIRIYNENPSPPSGVAVEVFQCTHDSYMYRITNSLTDFHLRNRYARPLRVHTKDGVKLITSLEYTIQDYEITYIRKPQKITLTDPHGDYVDFPEHAQKEIVKLAVQMYLENTMSQRYQSINHEVSIME